ncbi:hypothetical protein CCMA1212_000100 [Trichoderma ghanense]|uniref:SSCRP protein n=1 Tax=Trichoderma ghanense TaxID=65468 RepID=A0ABY2HEA3_9HYPO
MTSPPREGQSPEPRLLALQGCPWVSTALSRNGMVVGVSDPGAPSTAAGTNFVLSSACRASNLDLTGAGSDPTTGDGSALLRGMALAWHWHGMAWGSSASSDESCVLFAFDYCQTSTPFNHSRSKCSPNVSIAIRDSLRTETLTGRHFGARMHGELPRRGMDRPRPSQGSAPHGFPKLHPFPVHGEFAAAFRPQ